MSENKQPFPTFIGPSDTLRVQRFNSQRTINMYLEIDPVAGTGKNGAPASMMSFPGLKNLTTLAPGPIRCLYTSSLKTVMYIVSGNRVYQTTDLSSFTQIGTINTSTGFVAASDNGTQVVFVDGVDAYYASMLVTTHIASVGSLLAGFGYVDGTYANVPLTGDGQIITVGSLTAGAGYTDGVYNGINLSGGTGAGATANVVVSGGLVTSATLATGGTGYVLGDVLSTLNTNLGGTGSGFTINVTKASKTSGTGALATVVVAGTLITSVTVTSAGDGFVVGDILSTDNINLGGIGSGFSVTVATTTTAPTLLQIFSDNLYAADMITFQDGYFVLNQTGTIFFFISNLYDVTFPILNLAGKSGSSDNLIGIICNMRQLYLLGSNTFEVWVNNGGSGTTPFQRQDGKFSQTGCLAPATIQRMNNTFAWLGANPEGSAVVYMMVNDMPSRISTHMIETAIQHLPDLSKSTAYTWQVEGHYFYALNCPGLDTTYVYDLSTQVWVEQQHTDAAGTTGRHLAENHAVFLGQHIVGDYSNGNLYTYDYDTFTDNGVPIRRTRQAPHIAAALYNVFPTMLELDLSPGVGPTAGTDPRITLQISKDGSETFGNPIYGSLGKTGNFYNRVRFKRLGYGRDIVYRVTCSEPVKFNILSAWLEMDQGNG